MRNFFRELFCSHQWRRSEIYFLARECAKCGRQEFIYNPGTGQFGSRYWKRSGNGRATGAQS